MFLAFYAVELLHSLFHTNVNFQSGLVTPQFLVFWKILIVLRERVHRFDSQTSLSFPNSEFGNEKLFIKKRSRVPFNVEVRMLSGIYLAVHQCSNLFFFQSSKQLNTAELKSSCTCGKFQRKKLLLKKIQI